MSTRIFLAEASGIPGRAAQNGEMSAEKSAFCDVAGPCTDWCEMGTSDHFMQLYEDDAHLLDAVSRFIGTGIEGGDAAVVLATKPHRDYLEARLRAQGLDPATAREQGQYVPLDAAETLAKIMVDGCLDERGFFDIVGGVIARVGSRYPRVRAFGEMVALLWMEGNGDAALRLEVLWNDLIKIHAFSLLCAYPLSGFARAVHAQKFFKICAEHSHVIPTESYTALASPDERLRTIVQLQQKGNALEAEIAERKELEKSLRRSEQVLADFFDNTTMGLHWVSPEGIILDANQAGLNLLGYTREEYIGHPIAAFYADQRVMANILRRLHAGEELHDYEAWLVCKDGTLKYVLIDCNVLWEQGQFIHTRFFTRDITAQKRAEAAAQQLYAEFEHRVQERTAALRHEMAERQRLEREAQRITHFALLGHLAAGVSHEIRNPLCAIFLHVDLLEEELREPRLESAEEVMAAVAEIKTQLARLDDLVQDHLTLVRVASIQQDVQDLGAAVQVWGKEMEALAHPRGATVYLEGLEHLGLVAFHDDTLRRAVLNLVQNALDAMPQGGTITLAGARTPTHVQLEVRDTGCGMPIERLAQIFEPLYTTKPGGTGLGLYIVQEIVAAHGGQTTVQSAEGHGTTVTITLPWAADEAPVPTGRTAQRPTDALTRARQARRGR